VDDLETAQQARNEARNGVQRYGLAHADMRIALNTLRHLRSLPIEVSQEAADVRFALEAAIAVIYARPFKSARRRRLDLDEWTPSEERDRDRYWHDQFLAMRDTIYAHTDEYDASGRRIRFPEESEPPGLGYTEEWLGWEPGDDVEVEQLLDRQRVLIAVRATAAQAARANADARITELGGLSD
jgi:hypothetical protein